jgi:hypothetical protein
MQCWLSQAVMPIVASTPSTPVQRVACHLQLLRAWRALPGRMLWSFCLLVAMAGLGHAEVFHTTLDNGLTVLIEENHANPGVCGSVCPRRQYL